MLSKIAKHLQRDRKFLFVLSLTLLTRAGAAFGTLVLNLVLARHLGVAGVGLFMLALSIVIGLGVLARFGMDSALLRFGGIAYSEVNAQRFKGLLYRSLQIAGGISLLLAVLLGLGRGWIARSLFKDEGLVAVLLPMAILTPAYTFIYLQGTWLNALRKPALTPFFETGSVAFMTALLVVLAVLLGQTPDAQWVAWALLAATLLALCVGGLVLHRVIIRHFGDLYRTCSGEREPGFARSLPDYALMSLTTFSVQSGGVLVMGLFVGSSEIGLYSTAHRLAIVVNFILLVFNSIIAPQFASLHKRGALAELENLVNKSTLYMSAFALPLLLSFLIVPDLWLALFGTEFRAAAPLLSILAFAQFINVATGSVGFLLNMTGHQHEMRNIVLFIGALTIVLNFALIPMIGIWGATVATATALIVQNLLAAWRVYKVLGIVTLPGLKFLLKKINH